VSPSPTEGWTAVVQLPADVAPPPFVSRMVPHMTSAFALPVVVLVGAILLVAALRWWRPAFPRAAAVFHVLLTLVFFAPVLFTGGIQLPTDLAYGCLPWSESVAQPTGMREQMPDG